MPRWQRVYLAACTAIVGFMLAYIGVDYGRLPRLTYDQLRRGFRFAAPAPGLPSGYVGQWLWATLAALVAGGAAWALLGRRRAPAGDRALGLVLAWTLTAAALALGYFTWMNWP